MSQHDYDIANGGGAAVRADINAALAAIISQNSGATAPAVTKPFMFWYDTANSVLKQRNQADTAWVTFTDAAVPDASIIAAKLASASVTQSKLAAGVAGNGPAFSAYCSTNQTITTATYTKIALNTEEFDTNNNFDNATNYRFTPTVAGYYLISGCVYFNIAPTVFTNGSLYIFKNGSSFKFVNLDVNSTNGHFGSTVTSTVYLNGTTDYIELYIYHGIGLSQNLSGGGSNTYLSGSMVRSA